MNDRTPSVPIEALGEANWNGINEGQKAKEREREESTQIIV